MKSIITLYTDVSIPTMCYVSLVNGLGYRIEDSAITASSGHPHTGCRSYQTREIGTTTGNAWCSGGLSDLVVKKEPKSC